MLRLALPTLALLGLLAVTALAEDDTPLTRPVHVNAAGLSLALPDGWEAKQTLDAVLELEKGHAKVWFRAAPEERGQGLVSLQRLADQNARDANAKIAPRPAKWKVGGQPAGGRFEYVEHGSRKFYGVLPPGTGQAFHMEANLPASDDALQKEVVAILASVNVTPYQHPERHVGLNGQWTASLGANWILDIADEQHAEWTAVKQGDGPARVRVFALPTDRTSVDNLLRVVSAMSHAIPLVTGPKGLPERLEYRKRDGVQSGALDATKLAGDTTVQALRARARVSEGAAELIGPMISLAGFELGAQTIVVWVDGTAENGPARLSAILASLEITDGAAPGPRKEALPSGPDRFTNPGVPPVRFALPAGWTLENVKKPMRAAEFVPAEGLLGVVYFFGKGQGGSWEANKTRWTGSRQWKLDGDPVINKLEPAEGITVHTVELFGTHKAGRMSAPHAPAGHGDPHAAGKGGQRGFMAYIDVEGGPLTIKLVGPLDKMKRIAPAMRKWLKSLRLAE